MKEGYKIIYRGLSNFNKILVYNWEGMNQVDMVRWDEYWDFAEKENIVAIFKIRWK